MSFSKTQRAAVSAVMVDKSTGDYLVSGVSVQVSKLLQSLTMGE